MTDTLERPVAENRTDMVQAIYQVAVDPMAYDPLVTLWGDYLLDAVDDRTFTEKRAVPIAEEVSSHLLRIFEILDRLGRVTAAPEILRPKRAEIILDCAGNVLDCNDIAQNLLGCDVTRSVFELSLSPDSAEHLKAQLTERFGSEGEDIYLFFDQHEGLPYPMVCFAHKSATGELRAELSGLNQVWDDNHDEILQRLFGLTLAETRLARELLNGASLPQVADITSRSVETLRTQLKAIRRKTYTSSQQQLVRIMTGLENLARNPSQSASKAPGTHDHVLTLKDGRSLCYRTVGPSDGLPCLFLHNMLSDPRFSNEIERHIHQFGLRLICPIRPAFGASDIDQVALQSPGQAPDRLAGDLQQVLAHLGVKSCLVIGYMSGAVYGFRFAQRYPDLVSGIVNISGGVPIRDFSQFAYMNARQKVIALTARFTPKLLPSLLRAGIAQIDAGGVDEFLNALYRKTTPDRELMQRRELQTMLHEGFRQIVQQGHWGFAIDAFHVVRNWSEYCSNLDVPVHLMHGAHDPVVSAASVQRFAERMAFDCTVYDDVGQLLLLQKPDVVLARVHDMARATLAAA